MALLTLAAAPDASAQQNRASQTLTLTVKPIMQIGVSESNKALVLSDVAPDERVASVSDDNSTYSLFTNKNGAKILATLDAPLPRGTELRIKLDSTLGTSLGAVSLTSGRETLEVVRDIRQGREQNRPITYTFSADLEQVREMEVVRVVTLTVIE